MITSCGNVEISEPSVAPAPIETSNAGNAQQIIVPLLANKAR